MTTDLPEQPSEVDASEKKAGFSFPFSAFAKGAKDKTPLGYKPMDKSNHDKKPGRAPNGSRRSMGKR
ncbi:MAG: hypothetical protein AAGC84_14445 [Pseudomonas sp.]